MNRSRIGTSIWISALAAMGIAALLPTEASAAGPFQFYAITPCRAIDTRDVGQPWSGALNSGAPRNFTIKGAAPCNIPTDVAAVAINVTVTQAQQSGFLSLWPQDQAMPLVSTINFNSGELGLANGAITPLGATTPDLSVVYGVGVVGNFTVHVIIDINGYFK